MNWQNVVLALVGILLMYFTYKVISQYLIRRMLAERETQIEKLELSLREVREKISNIKGQLEIKPTSELKLALEKAEELERMLCAMLYEAKEQRHGLKKAKE
jgi:hypothetical protein